MHYNAMCGLAVACHLSVRLSHMLVNQDEIFVRQDRSSLVKKQCSDLSGCSGHGHLVLCFKNKQTMLVPGSTDVRG